MPELLIQIIPNIFFDLSICYLTFSTCQIKLIQLNFNIYMLIDIEFGQKRYRLHRQPMGKHVDGDKGLYMELFF